ncbi:MAG: class I SAM-dependent methyltransferase [SAR324 cluster bacterium]|nr:class I SAM-dependent methyltransferase [SAR324 cluster bacterium]
MGKHDRHDGPSHGHANGHAQRDPHRRGHGTGHKFDISRLERLRDPERLETMNPDKIWAVLADGLIINTLVDIGVGIGFFAIPFARKIKRGKVYGCDLHPEMLKYLEAAMEKEGVDNIEPVRCGEVEVPLEDGIADVVIMVNLHHELDFRDRSLAECRRLLRSGGKVAVIDWKPIQTEHGPPMEIRIPPEQVLEELTAAGFQRTAEHDIMPNHYFLTGVK